MHHKFVNTVYTHVRIHRYAFTRTHVRTHTCIPIYALLHTLSLTHTKYLCRCCCPCVRDRDRKYHRVCDTQTHVPPVALALIPPCAATMVVSLALGAIRMHRVWYVWFSTVIPWKERGEKRERENKRQCVYTCVCVCVFEHPHAYGV